MQHKGNVRRLLTARAAQIGIAQRFPRRFSIIVTKGSNLALCAPQPYETQNAQHR